MNCSESRVRDKLRHFLQHLRDLGFTQDWDLLFRDDQLIQKIERSLASHRSKTNPREWISGVRFGSRRSDGKSTGLVFRRSCYRDVYPTPKNEKVAAENGAAMTFVEL